MRKLLQRIKGLGGDRGAFAVAAVRAPVERILDIGCAYGWGLDALTGKARELVGIDMDQAALQQAARNYPHIRFIHQTAAKLPFPDEMFDVVILSEVIEHVGDENKAMVMSEAHRVLKNGGLFIFTAPYAGAFAWADPQDFKRQFPFIYRTYMRLSGYVPHDAVELGHKHIGSAEIRQLFGGAFDILETHHCGIVGPWLAWILVASERLHLLPRRIHDAIGRFRSWESGVPCPRALAFCVRILARKQRAIISTGRAISDEADVVLAAS